MTGQDLATVALCATIGLGSGWVMGGPVLAVALLVLGTVYGFVANRFRVRAVIAVVVFAATLIGAMIGARITNVLCLPGMCAALEVVAAIVTGIGAFVGVGLLAALVSRSFDEYRESMEEARPRPSNAGDVARDEAGNGEAPD